ncbi:MAG TPA: shikimate dehydrogenase [Gammaproteobacteria bacterium]|nr:shikimate dehydrogenase [Gammaproteobacteria bacterium]
MFQHTNVLPASYLARAGRARYAVLGDPINHSLSPRLFKLFAEHTHQIIDYRAFQTSLEDLAKTLKELYDQGYHGVNLTSPLKEKAYLLADELTVEAQQAKAVNMITFDAEGKALGHNTDGIGFVRDLTQIKNYPLNNKSILVLGAGGAVRGLLPFIIKENPNAITVCNRTESKAQALAEEFPESGSCAWQNMALLKNDLLINGTNAADALELPELNIPVWYDLAYGLNHSFFQKEAKKQEVVYCFDGLGMLIEQAAEAFFLWRGAAVDTHTFHHLLLTF